MPKEEVRSSYAYPKGYTVTPIREQVKILQRFFPGLEGADESIAQRELPEGAEGWFAIPKWERIAASHNEAIEKLLRALASSRKFGESWREFYNEEGQVLGRPWNLRQNERSIRFWQQISHLQGGDILVVAAQFGLKYRGRSVNRVHAVFTEHEFGLGAFGTGCMLLTNPSRLVAYENLWIDCAGDACSPDVDGRFGGAPCFSFFHGLGGGELYFDAHWVDGFYDHCGSVSAFLPQ